MYDIERESLHLYEVIQITEELNPIGATGMQRKSLMDLKGYVQPRYYP